jgi:hypothetical protein
MSGLMMEPHPHGWGWMHGRSGTGVQHHASMMGGSDHAWWLPGEALMIALMVALVAAIVVGIVLIARRLPTAPHAG